MSAISLDRPFPIARSRRDSGWRRAALWLARALMILAALRMLSGCGSSGSGADAPTDLAVKAGDGRVTLTWTPASGVEYWAFYAPANAITASNWTSLPGAVVLKGVGSPLTIAGLTNGTTYAFALNGRTDGGAGGPFTPSVTAVPRLAGGTWTSGTPIGASDLNAATYGAVGGNVFIAAGAGGTIATSPDGVTWTTVASSGTTADLQAIAFGGSSYVAAGAGGVVLYSTDAVTWTPKTSATTRAILGLTSNGGNFYVGVGAGGTIVYSNNGTDWTAATSGTSNDLLAVAYGNGRYVAVGAAGTVLASVDGANWTPDASATALDLRTITYGANVTANSALFVAAGASGAMVTSPDGITWTSRAALPVSGVNGVTFGRQFVLVGDAGAVYTSTDGTTWVKRTSGTNNTLKAVANNLYSYAAVGASGTNLSAM